MQTAPHRRASAFVILQKSPVLLRLFEFTTTMFDERSVPWRLNGDVKKPCARTLSRQIWQQKNFHRHSAGVSPTHAKANFSGRIATADSDALAVATLSFGSR
jgi:hypothetical protein